MREVDSKDVWYFGMAAIILSFTVNNFWGSFGLMLCGFVCGISYFIRVGREREIARRQEEEKRLMEAAKSFAGFVGNIFNGLRVEEKPKTPRRKTTSRRIKRK